MDTPQPARRGAAPPRSRARRLLTLGGVAAVAVAAVNAPAVIGRLVPPAFDFAPLDDPPGFRRLAGGAVSGGVDPLAGIGGGARPPMADPQALRADLCRALFDGPPPPGVAAVASFSDYYCPFCRVLTQRLAALEAEGAIRVAWHEWPLLGETSEAAARAALAARRQGAYVAFHAAMMRGGFVATPAFLREIAERLGLDADRMRADMAGPAVAGEIARARGLAALFGFAGTPALVIGRTVVVGAIDDRDLRALAALEGAEGPPPGCA